MQTWRATRNTAKLVALALTTLLPTLDAAPATARPDLILDFDGHTADNFPVAHGDGVVYLDLTIPSYPGDWDEILRRVKEDFAPSTSTS